MPSARCCSIEVAFKNVICLGLILDGEGQKMSKSQGNIVDPWDVLNAHGADAFRWYLYTATPPGQERRFSSDLVGEVVRNFTLTLWNVYSFFVTYANLDKPNRDHAADRRPGDLDRWLLSELNALVRDVTRAYETYDVTGATRPIEAFVEKLSTWYLRRSRRRFWKSESDSDKQAAYATLYTALVTVAKLLAPAMPFLADELYQNLVRSLDESAPESVHLADWPEVAARDDRRIAQPRYGAGDAAGLAGTCRPPEGQPQSAPAAGRSRLLGGQCPTSARPWRPMPTCSRTN